MGHLSIEKPCSEKWSRMSKRDEGRWCLACSKTVVDFSGKSSEEIIDYLKSKNGEEVCGRCRTDQVTTPGKKTSRYRWFVTVLSFVFGISLLTSCYRRTQGCMAYAETPKEKKHKKEMKADTTRQSRFQP
jgi:hypothetical protein